MDPKSSFLKKKNLDKVILLIIPAFATLIIFAFKLPFIISILLFFGLPSLWLSYRNKTKVIKALIYCIIAIPLILIIDYIAILDGSWTIPTIFPFRIFNVNSVEGLLWAMSFMYSIVIYYESFYNVKDKKFSIGDVKYALLIVIIVSAIFLIILNVDWKLLEIPYIYLKGGIVLFVIPIVCLLILKRELLRSFIKIALHFFFVTLLFELTGACFNHWYFPGNHFIGWIYFFGHKIPFEELLIFICLGSSGVLAHYKIFIDRKDM